MGYDTYISSSAIIKTQQQGVSDDKHINPKFLQLEGDLEI